MTLAVKLLACQFSNQSTPTALAKYVYSLFNIELFNFFKENCPLGCPCDGYDCDLPEKKAILALYNSGSSSRPPVLIQPEGECLTLVFI